MKPRKIALLSSIALLFAICVFQCLLAYRDPVKILALADSDAPDSIAITRADGSSVTIAKAGDGWVTGDKKYPADKAKVESMLAALSSVKVLGAVSLSRDYERYGLAEGSRVTVTASKAGKIVRTIGAGKNAVSAGQSYGIIDGGKSVVLVSGSLRDVFDLDAESLRNREIWSIGAEGITRIESVSPSGSFAMAKAGESASWQMALPESAKNFALDAEKTSSWVRNFASMRADSFAADGTAAPENPAATFTVHAAGRQITLTVGSKNGDGKYLCFSSESPYAFYVTEAVAGKLLDSYTGLGK